MLSQVQICGSVLRAGPSCILDAQLRAQGSVIRVGVHAKWAYPSPSALSFPQRRLGQPSLQAPDVDIRRLGAGGLAAPRRVVAQRRAPARKARSRASRHRRRLPSAHPSRRSKRLGVDLKLCSRAALLLVSDQPPRRPSPAAPSVALVRRVSELDGRDASLPRPRAGSWDIRLHCV